MDADIDPLFDSFEPQALTDDHVYFSTTPMGHSLSHSLSNRLGSTLGSPSGSSFLDSPYGSYQEDFLTSPGLASPPVRSLGASLGAMASPSNLNPKSLKDKDKLSRRRELHNAVERRRRDLIKEKIKELGDLIPPVMYGKDKANKSVILNKSVEYIRALKNIMDSQDKRLDELRAYLNDGVPHSAELDNEVSGLSLPELPDINFDLHDLHFDDSLDIPEFKEEFDSLQPVMSNEMGRQLSITDSRQPQPVADAFGSISAELDLESPEIKPDDRYDFGLGRSHVTDVEFLAQLLKRDPTKGLGV
ncbi:Rtg3 protein [Martiniozyma asiatica (nom. inval.)]|nr:Rtg3 protein [Martiniozyma asiatica]